MAAKPSQENDDLLQRAISQIDIYVSKNQLSTIKFLATSCAPCASDAHDIPELLQMLCTALNGNEKEAVTVLYHILEKTGTSKDLLQSLRPHCYKGRSASDIAPDLPFYELLCVVAAKIEDGQNTLSTLCEIIELEKVDMHPDDITSALQLLQSMLRKKTIQPSNLDYLTRLLKLINRKDIVKIINSCKVHRESFYIVQTQYQAPQPELFKVDASLVSMKSMTEYKLSEDQQLLFPTDGMLIKRRSDSYGSLHHLRKRYPHVWSWCPFRCHCRYFKMKLGAVLCVLLALLVFVIATITVAKVYKDKHLQDKQRVYNEITYFAFEKPLKLWNYEEAKLTISHDEYKDFLFHHCQVDCSNGVPKPTIYQYNYSHTILRIPTDNCPQWTRYVLLNNVFINKDSLNERQSSMYMLENSLIVFNVSGLHRNESYIPTNEKLSVSLYIFQNVSACKKFFYNNCDNRSIELSINSSVLSESNGYEYTYSVPSTSYYCAVWRAPRSVANFTYTVNATVLTYSNVTKQHDDSCESVTSANTQSGIVSADISLKGQGSSICLFVTQQTSALYSWVDVEILVFYHPIHNVYFIVFVIGAVGCFLCFLCCVVIFVLLRRSC